MSNTDTQKTNDARSAANGRVGSSDSSAWVRTADRLPPNKVEVETKLDDSTCGVRNVQTLKRSGNLWFFPDMSMYVYYHPTHWRSLPNVPGQPRSP